MGGSKHTGYCPLSELKCFFVASKGNYPGFISSLPDQLGVVAEKEQQQCFSAYTSFLRHRLCRIVVRMKSLSFADSGKVSQWVVIMAKIVGFELIGGDGV